jgi:hypothetical protein
MTSASRVGEEKYGRVVACLVLAGATLIALLCARLYAGCWNDGSRLAAVECLVDRHTFAIDDSIFVRVPPGGRGVPSPYWPLARDLQKEGTKDKLYIAGHYYSDKSPVPAVLLAGVYQVARWCTGLTARLWPAGFCYLMTLVSSGLSFVVAVWCVYRLGGSLGLAVPARLLLAASLALGTVALPYAEYVNNHSLLLGVAAALLLGLVACADRQRVGFWQVFGLGTLAGLGYSIDLGAGPVLLLCTFALILYRSYRRAGVLRSSCHLVTASAFLLGALPWLALHHALNYAVGGTWVPANAVAAYFRWPDCPFTEQTMTGGWKHDGPRSFLVYAAALLAGKRGFLTHNLPLLLTVPAVPLLLWRRVREWPELVWGTAWAAGTWLLYSANSNNYAGACCSIRWFVPLLAPGYYALAVWLKYHPRARTDLFLLSACGGLLVITMAKRGPWNDHLLPYFWPIVGLAVGSCLVYHVYCRCRPGQDTQGNLAGQVHREQHRGVAPVPPAPRWAGATSPGAVRLFTLSQHSGR